MKAPEPLQFTLASLMVMVLGYALLFGALRCIGVGNLAFVLVTLYFTTVLYGQWTLFAGRRPFEAAFLVSGMLFALGSLAEIAASLRSSTPDQLFWVSLLFPVFAFLFGGLAGAGVAGIVDMGLLLTELINPNKRRQHAMRRPPFESLDNKGSRDGDPPADRKWLVVLACLASMFSCGMFWKCMGDKGWMFQMLTGL